MNLCPVLVLSLGLVGGTVLPTSAQLPLRQAPAVSLCEASASAADSGTAKGQAIVATVTRVDPRQGKLKFTTQTGSFVLTTTPEEMYDLQVGDQLLLCLHEDGSDGEERVAEDDPAATPKPHDALSHQSEPTPEHRTPLEAGQGEPRQ